MIRGPLYTGMAIVGCVAGVTFGYLSMHDLLEAVISTNTTTEISMPKVLTQEGTVRYTDTQSSTIVLDFVSPHDPKTRTTIKATYTDHTSLIDQLGHAIKLSDIHDNDRVGVAIMRKVGAFELVRLSKL